MLSRKIGVLLLFLIQKLFIYKIFLLDTKFQNEKKNAMLDQKSRVWPRILKNLQNVSENNSSICSTEKTHPNGLLLDKNLNSIFPMLFITEFVCFPSTLFILHDISDLGASKSIKNDKIDKMKNFQDLYTIYSLKDI